MSYGVSAPLIDSADSDLYAMLVLTLQAHYQITLRSLS